jgi:metallo-beta-lactamase family protein
VLSWSRRAALRFLVDCGMHQGGREARARNLKPWPFDPADIDFVLLTHAHIDHSGLLPRLCALGFKGPILHHRATADLLAVMLLDSAFIQESRLGERRSAESGAAAHAGREPALLYTVAQAEACLEQVQGVAYDETCSRTPGVRCRFRDAGHILGSAILEVWISEAGHDAKLVFSGDLGQPGRPIVRDPTPIGQADVLVVESTYGEPAAPAAAAKPSTSWCW